MILAYREFITDNQFSYLITIQKSILIIDGLCPYNKEGDNYFCNQTEIGECIFNLYEQSKALMD